MLDVAERRREIADRENRRPEALNLIGVLPHPLSQRIQAPDFMHWKYGRCDSGFIPATVIYLLIIVSLYQSIYDLTMGRHWTNHGLNWSYGVLRKNVRPSTMWLSNRILSSIRTLFKSCITKWLWDGLNIPDVIRGKGSEQKDLRKTEIQSRDSLLHQLHLRSTSIVHPAYRICHQVLDVCMVWYVTCGISEPSESRPIITCISDTDRTLDERLKKLSCPETLGASNVHFPCMVVNASTGIILISWWFYFILNFFFFFFEILWFDLSPDHLIYLGKNSQIWEDSLSLSFLSFVLPVDISYRHCNCPSVHIIMYDQLLEMYPRRVWATSDHGFNGTSLYLLVNYWLLSNPLVRLKILFLARSLRYRGLEHPLIPWLLFLDRFHINHPLSTTGTETWAEIRYQSDGKVAPVRRIPLFPPWPSLVDREIGRPKVDSPWYKTPLITVREMEGMKQNVSRSSSGNNVQSQSWFIWNQ